MNEIEFGPFIVNTILPLMGVILAALSAWALKWLGTKTKLLAHAETRAYLEKAIANAIPGVIKSAQDYVGTKKLTLHVKNEAVAAAANYVIATVPDALKMLKISEAGLKAKIEKMLPGIESDKPKRAPVPAGDASA